MKKTLSLILTLALIVGVIAGISAPAYAATPTGGFSITDKRGPATVEEDVAATYKSAMLSVERGISNSFLDPREAWDYFITHKESTNWFGKDTSINALDYCSIRSVFKDKRDKV